jgi:hypothetical protein
MKVLREIAGAHARNLEDAVKDSRTELCLNVDEVGLHDWAEGKSVM